MGVGYLPGGAGGRAGEREGFFDRARVRIGVACWALLDSWAPFTLSLSLNSFYFPEQKISKKKRRRKKELGIEFGHVDNLPRLTKNVLIPRKIEKARSNKRFRTHLNLIQIGLNWAEVFLE